MESQCINDQTHTLNIIGVIKSTGWEFENYLKYAYLCQHLIADVIIDRIEAPTTGCMGIHHSRGPSVDALNW